MAKMRKDIISRQKGEPSKIYAKNMNALKHKDIELYNKIDGLPTNPYYQIFRDNPKAPYNLFFMEESSPIPYYADMGDPVGEAERDVDGLEIKTARMAFFLGMGLGYELLYFVNYHARTHRTELMFIVERDPHIFKKALEATDLTDVIRRSDTRFYVDMEPLEVMRKFKEIIQVLQYLFLIKCVGLIINSPAFILFKEYYNNLINEYRQAVVTVLYMYGDSMQDSLLGQSNMFLNLKNIVEHPGINMLFDAFKGKPAIVCGSGPSLQKELELLKEYQDKVLVLTAESTLWPLLKNGVYPTISCTLERTGKADDYFLEFEYEKLKNTYLAVAPVVQPHLYENYKGPIINAFRAFGHFMWLPFDKGTLNIGMSSANMAFKLAHKLGCNPIILIGQDLCYDRETNATHSPGYMAGTHQEHVYKQEQLELMANDGLMSKTTNVWKLFYDGYVKDIPEYHKDVPDGLVINTSEKGARIPDTIYMPFAEAAKEYLNNNTYNPLTVIREKLKGFDTGSISSDMKKLHAKIDIAVSELKEMVSFCDDGIGLVNEYLEEFEDIIKDTSAALHMEHRRKARLNTAAKAIRDKKGDVTTKYHYTFNILGMHVVQSYYIQFGIRHEVNLSTCETEEARNLQVIKDYKDFFLSMGSMLIQVRDSVIKGKEIVDELESNISEGE